MLLSSVKRPRRENRCSESLGVSYEICKYDHESLYSYSIILIILIISLLQLHFNVVYLCDSQ